MVVWWIMRFARWGTTGWLPSRQDRWQGLDERSFAGKVLGTESAREKEAAQERAAPFRSLRLAAASSSTPDAYVDRPRLLVARGGVCGTG